jgi:hypothetical protein
MNTGMKNGMNKTVKGFAGWGLALLVLSCFTFVYGSDSQEDAANTGFQLIEEPISPRAIGMGGAGAALRESSFAFYNPALPFLVNRTSLSACYGGYPRADWNRAAFEGIVSLSDWFIGLHFNNESVSDLYRVDDFGKLPDLSHSSSWQSTTISLGAGYSRWENFALGVSFNGVQEHLFDNYAYALSGSFGAIYIPAPRRFTIGLSFVNIGFSSTPMVGADKGDAWGQGERVPFTGRLGMVWSDSIKKIPYTVALDVAYRNVRDRDKSFTRHIQNRVTVPVGLEVCPVGPLALRIGKRFNHPTEVLSLGIGFNVDFLSTDISFVIPRLVDGAEMKWLADITYYLKKRHPKKSGDTTKSTVPVSIKKTTIDTVVSPVVLPPLPVDSAKAAILPDTAAKLIKRDSSETSVITRDSLVVKTMVIDTFTKTDSTPDADSTYGVKSQGAFQPGDTVVLENKSPGKEPPQKKPDVTPTLPEADKNPK